jgi:hypothetical protein
MKEPQGLLSRAMLAGVTLTLTLTSLSSQTVSRDPLKQPVRVRLAAANTPDRVAQALMDAEIPGGLALIHYCGGFPEHSLKPATLSLRGLLDAVVSADPQYSWEMDKGVVNLVPRYGAFHVLETRISKLDLENVKTPDEALNRLLALPEVEAQTRRELGSRVFQGGAFAYPATLDLDAKGAKTFSVTATNITLRDALNLIAISHGKAVWVLARGECANNVRKSFSIKFIYK